MTKSFLRDAKVLDTAVQLIRLGARPPVVDALTSIGQEKAVRLYREILGKAPPKGQLPSLGRWYIRSVNSGHSAYFLHVYEDIVAKSGCSVVDGLISAYRIYLSYPWNDGSEGLSFDRAWWLVRLFQIDGLVKVRCVTCNCYSVTEANEARSRYICYFCRSRQKKFGVKPVRKEKLLFSQIYPDNEILSLVNNDAPNDGTKED